MLCVAPEGRTVTRRKPERAADKMELGQVLDDARVPESLRQALIRWAVLDRDRPPARRLARRLERKLTQLGIVCRLPVTDELRKGSHGE